MITSTSPSLTYPTCSFVCFLRTTYFVSFSIPSLLLPQHNYGTKYCVMNFKDISRNLFSLWFSSFIKQSKKVCFFLHLNFWQRRRQILWSFQSNSIHILYAHSHAHSLRTFSIHTLYARLMITTERGSHHRQQVIKLLALDPIFKAWNCVSSPVSLSRF